MALQIWLPLDGTLENKGCTEATITNNEATIEPSGKIGKCYSFNGTNNYISGTPTFLNNNTINWSFACWFKPTISHVGCIFSNRNYTSSEGITIFYYNNNFYFDDGIRWTFPSTSISIGEWNHITFTRNSTEKRFYLNGKLLNSTNIIGTLTKADTVSFLIGNSQRSNTNLGSNWLNGQLNDVRIYDHCLSPAEVHEISQGLVQHFKLDSSSLELNWLEPTEEKIVVRSTSNKYIDYPYNSDLINCPDTEFTVDFDAYGTANDMNVDVYFRDASGHAYTDYTLINTTLTTEWEHYTLPIIGSPADLDLFRFRCKGGTAGDIFHIKNMRLTSNTMSIKNAPIIDSSGYNHHGSTYGTPITSINTPRYNSCIYLDGASAINAGRGGMVTDSITANIWINYSSGERLLSCYETGGIGFSQNPVQFNIYAQKGYRSAIATSQSLSNLWYMITGVYDRLNGKVKIYINGKLNNEKNIEIFEPITYNKTNSLFIGAEATSSSTTPSNNFLTGYVSDFRIYCTPLSDEDIAELYHTSAKIDKLGNIHALEFNECNKVNIQKNGIIKSTNFFESIDLIKKLKYDLNIYSEPDGSEWIRIFHHNNPTNGNLFSKNDNFEDSVYLDENRWFNMAICNIVNTWEIMIKQKATDTSTEQKFRWIQNANPMIAAHDDVGYNNITKITTNGYVNSSNTYGGIYYRTNNSSFLLENTNNMSSTWGRIGAWGEYKSGIAGWDKVIVTTGYMDVYLRMDNQPKNISKIYKNQQILANEFIER